MKKYLGDVLLKGNLDVLSDKPLDSRLVVLNKSDLYILDPRYIYEGMPVSCVGTGKIYMLIDKTLFASSSGWVECSGGGSGNGGDYVVLEQDEYEALQEVDPDTLYFIYEPWEFGSNFPIYFLGWRFGDPFPVNLL